MCPAYSLHDAWPHDTIQVTTVGSGNQSFKLCNLQCTVMLASSCSALCIALGCIKHNALLHRALNTMMLSFVRQSVTTLRPTQVPALPPFANILLLRGEGWHQAALELFHPKDHTSNTLLSPLTTRVPLCTCDPTLEFLRFLPLSLFQSCIVVPSPVVGQSLLVHAGGPLISPWQSLSFKQDQSQHVHTAP